MAALDMMRNPLHQQSMKVTTYTTRSLPCPIASPMAPPIRAPQKWSRRFAVQSTPDRNRSQRGSSQGRTDASRSVQHTNPSTSFALIGERRAPSSRGSWQGQQGKWEYCRASRVRTEVPDLLCF